MDLGKLLGVNINAEEIEKAALDAKKTQAEMLEQIKAMNQKLEIIKYAAEEVVRFLKTGPLAKP